MDYSSTFRCRLCVLLFNALTGVNHKLRIAKFGLMKLETWRETYFDILNHSGVTHEYDGRRDRQTDRQTDSMLIANAGVHCVAQPKIKAVKLTLKESKNL